MGDLISVCLKHNQLPPKKTKQKNSREHDNYRFPLILVLISEVTAHCREEPCFLFLVRLTQKLVKRGRNRKKGRGNYKIAAWLLGWLGSVFRANVWLGVSVFNYGKWLSVTGAMWNCREHEKVFYKWHTSPKLQKLILLLNICIYLGSLCYKGVIRFHRDYFL